MMRLNKFIAQAGICSRRKADELIVGGQIKVNGKVVTELGTVVDELSDEVYFSKRRVALATQKAYFALNKPVGYITSSTSAQGKSVLELVKGITERVFPVGRLDKDSCGLIILSDDGDLAYRLTQAKFDTEKEYEVTLDRPLADRDIKAFESGLDLDGERLRPIKVAGRRGKKVNLILKQGVNRQIRRMAELRGYEVLELKRIRIGKLLLGNLKEGGYIRIRPQDII